VDVSQVPDLHRGGCVAGCRAHHNSTHRCSTEQPQHDREVIHAPHSLFLFSLCSFGLQVEKRGPMGFEDRPTFMVPNRTVFTGVPVTVVKGREHINVRAQASIHSNDCPIHSGQHNIHFLGQHIRRFLPSTLTCHQPFCTSNIPTTPLTWPTHALCANDMRFSPASDTTTMLPQCAAQHPAQIIGPHAWCIWLHTLIRFATKRAASIVRAPPPTRRSDSLKPRRCAVSPLHR